MNNNQYFDENIRERFSNYSPDVHPRIWENIAAKKDRRKPAGFWITFFNGRNMLLLLGLFLAIGTGAFFLVRNNTGLPAATPQNTPSAIANNANTYPGSELPVAGPENKDINPINNTVNTAATPGQLVQINNQTVSTSATSVPVLQKTLSNNEWNITSTPTGSLSIRSMDIISKGMISQPVTKSTKEGSPEEWVEETDNLSLGGTLLGRLTYNALKTTTHRIPESGIKNRRTPAWLLPDCPKLENDAAGNKKYLEVYGGPDFAIRKLSDTGNSVYLQKRKESTKFSSAYSAGLRYTRVFNSGMSLRAGVNYSQINEKFTYVQGNLVQITYIINVNGDTTGSYITTGTRYKTTYNKYRSVDVPVLVGYEMGNGKIHANISAGAVVNLYSWQKGEVLDTSYQPVSITTGKGSAPYQFKTNAGVGFITSASVYYKLNEKVHIMAEPYFRYNFAPMNNETLTLKQKYSTVGLRFGIRVDLK